MAPADAPDGRRISTGGSLASTNLPPPATATYDLGNQLSKWNSAAATTDANGNLTSDPSVNGTYAWNERNQLASAATGTGSLGFSYDALGRRVQVTQAAASTNYVYDGLNGVEEKNSSGGVTADMLGGGLDDWFTRTDSSGTNAMLRDGMNSTEGLVNSSGSLATQFAYEPFGRTTFSGAGTSNLYRFTGRELDATGLYFMRARYYNPVLQRFLSPDPLGFNGGSVDLYSYAFDSPTNFIDPLGLAASGCGGGGGGGGAPTYDPKNKTWTLPDGFQIVTVGSSSASSDASGSDQFGPLIAGGPEGGPLVGILGLDVSAVLEVGAGVGGVEGGLAPVVTVRTPSPTPTVVMTPQTIRSISTVYGVGAVAYMIESGEITLDQTIGAGVEPDALYGELLRRAFQRRSGPLPLPPSPRPANPLGDVGQL